MGCGTSRESKMIEILIELCSVWKYDERCTSVKENIIKPLCDEGFTVKEHFIPLEGGKGEFFIYKIEKDGNKKIIFSNKIETHPNAPCQGTLIDSENNKEVINELKKIK